MNAARFDALVTSFARRRAPVQPGTSRSVSAAPLFSARTLAGRLVTATELLAPGRPLLLIFVHPSCGPCYELLPNVAGWSRVYGDRLTIALVSAGTPERNRAMLGDDGITAAAVLVQAEHELADRFGVEMAPAALLIQPDGRLTGEPALGADAIRQLVATTLGLALRPTPAPAAVARTAGESVPAIRRPTIDGAVVELGGPQATPTLLLFISPGCPHCDDLLPQIRDWETRTEGPRLLMISRGPLGLNRDLALRAPMILDDDRALAETFGVSGTPAAVLIDAGGVVVAQAPGATQVREIGAHLFDRELLPTR